MFSSYPPGYAPGPFLRSGPAHAPPPAPPSRPCPGRARRRARVPGLRRARGGATASDAPAGAGAHGTPDGHPDGIRGLAGGSYFGVVKVRVVPPDGSGIRATTRNGRASASLEPSGRLVVSGDVDRESDAGFAAEGRFSSGGWEGGSGAVELRIGPDGSIADDGNRMEIEGRVDHRRLDLPSSTPNAVSG